jgi:nicotinamide phosphoribosyltransferase
MKNIIVNSDSYKASHALQYPKGTTHISSYLESRGGDYEDLVFFGLQPILEKHLAGVVVTQEKLDYATKFWNQHFGTEIFHGEMWQHIIDNHGGRLPIRIKAVPEGTVVPLKNVLMTIENTDPKCFALTNFLETLLMQIWYPITIATNSREIKKAIHWYLQETGDPTLIGFKLHDFGFRGVSSFETSEIGAAAHLVNFMGTDTVSGILFAMEYYNAGMIGFSIPASEHSTMTSWGKENEARAYENLLDTYPEGMVACVSDSYDIYNACENIWGTELHDKIVNRNGTLVIRPDSGDPVEVNRKLLHILWEKFPGHVNEKGYKVIDSHVRIIQGDGIDRKMVNRILQMMKEEGFSADNMAFGSGGGLLQKFDRDTLKFAIKCSHAIIDGEEVDVQKDPVTAKGKKSKAGRLKLVKTEDGFVTVSSRDCQPEHFESLKDEMVTVFENGEILVKYDFDSIRERAKI